MAIITAAIALLLLLVAVPASADGGGPLLLLLSVPLFVVGQIWIILSEFVYVKLLHRHEPSRTVLRAVIVMNLISMVLGGLALPLLFALVGLLGGLMMLSPHFEALGAYVFAAGTWIAGDNSPHATLALAATGAGFVATYFVTVYVERWYLHRQTQKGLFPHTGLMHCYCLNAVSYLGLAASVGVFEFLR